MNNIVFWAHSYCRSTLKFYSELAKALQRNCLIYTWIENLELRSATGFNNAEFPDLKIMHIGNNQELANQIMERHLTDYNIFCAYQICSIYQHLMNTLIKKGIKYGVFSEAPCNMEYNTRRFIKMIYLHCYLPLKLKVIIRNADFILNASGYYEEALLKMGWKSSQIVSCGYYPPRIPQSKTVERTNKHWQNFTILLTGLHQWHRSPWLLLKALNVLKGKGYEPKCYITQKGPYLTKLQNYVISHSLSNVEFLGFVDISKLISLYETCSVYIGCGNYEPWGMRLNDCLSCGSPLIVNRGMGGVKMVDEYKCGLSFERNDYIGLANAIEKLMSDKELFLETARNASQAAQMIQPEQIAERFAQQIKKFIK